MYMVITLMVNNLLLTISMGIRNDNRIENLRISSGTENSRNMKMYSRNTSGITGVTRQEITRPSGKIDSYWIASWCNESGKLCNKYFSIHTYGEAEAKQLATDYRAEQIRRLEVGFGILYSGRHGVHQYQ